MKNYLGSADSVSITATSACAAGDLVIQGDVLGVAQTSAAIGETLDLIPRGRFRLPAASADTWAASVPLYWDVANKRLSATSGVFIGPAMGAKSVGSTAADVEVRGAGALSVADVQALHTLVSTAGVTTWANRGAVVAAGLTTAFFTDIGVGGTYFDYVGGKWRPQARRAMLKSLVSSLSHNSGPKIVLAEATILPGLMQDGDLLVVEYLKTKEGGTADTETTDFLIGATSGTLGTSLALTTGALSTTTQQVSSRYVYRRESATTIRPISITGPQGIGSSTAAPAGVITVPNMDSQTTYLQISGDMTTGGGAETVYLRGFSVELVAGA